MLTQVLSGFWFRSIFRFKSLVSFGEFATKLTWPITRAGSVKNVVVSASAQRILISCFGKPSTLPRNELTRFVRKYRNQLMCVHRRIGLLEVLRGMAGAPQLEPISI